MQIAGRGFGKIAGSVLHRRNYIAARNMLRVYEHPVEIFRRYLTGAGTYPTVIRVRTPLGWVSLQLYTALSLEHSALDRRQVIGREPALLFEQVAADGVDIAQRARGRAARRDRRRQRFLGRDPAVAIRSAGAARQLLGPCRKRPARSS